MLFSICDCVVDKMGRCRRMMRIKHVALLRMIKCPWEVLLNVTLNFCCAQRSFKIQPLTVCIYQWICVCLRALFCRNFDHKMFASVSDQQLIYILFGTLLIYFSGSLFRWQCCNAMLKWDILSDFFFFCNMQCIYELHVTRNTHFLFFDVGT